MEVHFAQDSISDTKHSLSGIFITFFERFRRETVHFTVVVPKAPPPGSQEAFGGPIAGILVQNDLDPDRSAEQAFGNQLGKRWSGEGAVARADAGPLIPPPVNHAAMGTHFNLDLFGVFRVATQT